jgi:hypothetical protein
MSLTLVRENVALPFPSSDPEGPGSGTPLEFPCGTTRKVEYEPFAQTWPSGVSVTEIVTDVVTVAEAREGMRNENKSSARKSANGRVFMKGAKTRRGSTRRTSKVGVRFPRYCSEGDEVRRESPGGFINSIMRERGGMKEGEQKQSGCALRIPDHQRSPPPGRGLPSGVSTQQQIPEGQEQD